QRNPLRIQGSCRFQRRMNHRAEGKKCGDISFTQHFGTPDRKSRKRLVQRNAVAVSAGVAHGSRGSDADGGGKHVLKFVFVFGGHQGKVGKVAHVREIKGAVMGRTVTPDNPAAIYGKRDRQVLQTDIMANLVISTLQKTGINSKNRTVTAGG